MMSTVEYEDEVHWLHPPPPPLELKTLPLSGMNQMFLPCDQVFIVPGPIDVRRLKAAILSWLTLVRHAAGRLSRGEDRSLAIDLSYPIPITLSTYTGTYTDAEVYAAFPPFLDPLPWISEPPEDSENHPLTRFKITNITRTGETAIAIHMCHAVVDGTSLFRVLNILNDLYCGAHASDLVPVTYENYIGPPPPFLDPRGDAYARAMKKMPYFSKRYPPEAQQNKFTQSLQNVDRVDLLFSKEQMDVLLRRANDALRGKAAGRVTTANVLPAYLYTVLNRVYGSPKFDRVFSVLGIRGIPTPEGCTPYRFPSETSAGMAFIQAVSEPFPREQLLDMPALAVCLRDHTDSCLEPKALLNITSAYEQRLLEFSKEGQAPYMLPEDGEGILCVNLMHKTNVRIHFGYGADRCWFFTWPALKHYIRAFKANPVRRDDGTWDAQEGVLRAAFLVESGYGGKVYDIVKEDLEKWCCEDAEKRRALAKL